MLSAVRATSGMFRMVVEPWLAVMLMPCCQVGIAKRVLTPPLLASAWPGNQLHTFSDTHDPPGPLVVKVVPPTTVMYGSSDGSLIVPVGYSPLSPEASKNDCPCAAYCRKI